MRALVALSLLGAIATHAAAHPAGLKAGDTYHLALVTSSLTNVTGDRSLPPPSFTLFGGTAAADWVVTLAAAEGAVNSEIDSAFGLTPDEFMTGDPNTPWDFLSGHWQAVLSDSGLSGDGGDARDRLTIDGPVYNTQGELVATDLDDLFDGQIDAPILYDETGAEVTGNLSVWSGTTPAGVWGGQSCGDWDNPSSSNSGDTGIAGATNSTWILGGFSSCNQSARLYGISPAFTVPVRGDFNGDGAVDAADYTVWRDSLGQTGMGLAADANNDGVVDTLDYDLWVLDFGYEEPASNTVPEPSALVLALAALASGGRRRGRLPLA